MKRNTALRSFSARLLLLLGTSLILTLSTGFGLPERYVLMPSQRSQSVANLAQSRAIPGQATAPKSIEGRSDPSKSHEPATFTSMLGKWVANGFKALGDALLKGCVWLVNGVVSALLSMLR